MKEFLINLINVCFLNKVYIVTKRILSELNNISSPVRYKIYRTFRFRKIKEDSLIFQNNIVINKTAWLKSLEEISKTKNSKWYRL